MKKIIIVLILININLFAFFAKKDATFSKIYPTPFTETVTGKIVINTGVVGMTAAASILGGPGGTATAIVVATELGLIGLSELIPDTNYKGTFSMMQLPLSEIGSKEYKRKLENIENIKSKFEKGEFNYQQHLTELNKTYKKILYTVDSATENDYDMINRAILEFNVGYYNKSRESINLAINSFDKKSYIFYHLALLDLVNNDIQSAINNLNKSIKEEENSLKPYLLLSIIYENLGANNSLNSAQNIILKGLENYDDESFELNSRAGYLFYKTKNYNKAIEYYEEALSNMTIDTLEAETKIHLSNSYFMNGNTKQAAYYLYDVLYQELSNVSIEMKQKYMNMLVFELKEKN